MKIKTGKNNLLQHYSSSRHLLDDHNIFNDTKNRAETTYLNIFLSLKSGSFWVRGTIDINNSAFSTNGTRSGTICGITDAKCSNCAVGKHVDVIDCPTVSVINCLINKNE